MTIDQLLLAILLTMPGTSETTGAYPVEIVNPCGGALVPLTGAAINWGTKTARLETATMPVPALESSAPPQDAVFTPLP